MKPQGASERRSAFSDAAVLRACPICAGRRIDVLHHQDFATPFELKAPPAYDVVACERCGFVYANQRVEQNELDVDYAAHSKYAPPSASIAADPPWDLERLAGVAAYLTQRIADKSMRVLDAGCANGSFLGFMKANGFSNVVGLDPSPAAVANARARYGVDALAGSFVSPPASIGSFDVVTLSHTLEHLADVGGAVTSLKALLVPNGIAYIEVPDASRYADYLVAPFHDFNTEHINHFSLRILRLLMRRHGFVEIDANAGTVRNSPTDDYPVIFGLWRANGASDASGGGFPSLEPDEDLVASIRKYVELSSILMHRMDEQLALDLADSDEVIVWGAGQLTMKLLRNTVLREKRVVAVVDASVQRQGMHMDSTSILAPAALHDMPPFPIVIGSLLSETSIVTMIREQLHLKNPIVRLHRPA